MKRRHLIAAALSCVGLTACAAGHDPVAACDASQISFNEVSHPRRDAFAQALRRATAGVVPGAVMAIHDADGTWVGATGWADIDHQVRLQPCHAFPVASVTKSMTATVVFQLAEAGALDLDAPIDTDLDPDLAGRIRNSDVITVRMLLNHSSGIPNYTDLALNVSRIAKPGFRLTVEQAIDRIAGRSLFPPGSKTRYSNTDSLVASRIAERVTGRSYRELFEEHMVRGLGMSSTRYDPDAPFDGIIRGYLDLDGDGVFIDSNWTNYMSNLRDASSGAISTAPDLLTFVDALQRDGAAVSTASLAAMHTSMAGGNESDHERGFGQGLVDYDFGDHGPAWGHAGVALGITTRTYYFPDQDVSMVLAVNGFSMGFSGGVAATLETEVIPSLLDTVLTPFE